MPDTLEIQQGEGKWIRFTITQDGSELDVSGATKYFGMKRKVSDDTYVYDVENAETAKWDVTAASTGLIRVNLPASITKDLSIDTYEAQARFILTADTDVDKTQTVKIKITKPVIHET
jgi:hypothetical protein